jgi:metal-dependent amidase/aminoacylase/carboxypeptidase family protein
MHNCGHDMHAAILLGTASIMSANKDRFVGKIVFLFQPAEETPGGADDIVREGILRRLGVERTFAQHVAPGMPVGTVALQPGYSLAGSNYFHLKLKSLSGEIIRDCIVFST